MSDRPITVVSVLGPNDGPYWEITSELLTKHLRDRPLFFHLVDNYETSTADSTSQTIIYRRSELRYRGSEATRGSIEHGRCLNYVMSQLLPDSGTILVIDPDFFIVNGHMLRHLIHKVETRKVTMLGTTWHRRWVTKSQHWVAPHLVLFDSSIIEPRLLNFSPGFSLQNNALGGHREQGPGASIVNLAYRKTFGYFRSKTSPDTGYMVAEQVRAIGGHLLLLFPARLRRLPSAHVHLLQSSSVPADVARKVLKLFRGSEFFQDSNGLWAIHLRKQARTSAAPSAATLREAVKLVTRD